MEAKKFSIRKNIHLTEKLYLLELEGHFKKSPSPGQFVHIKIEPFFLRRPFSVAGHKDNHLKILYRVAGRATDVLTGKKNGELLDIIGPLGNGFPLNNKYKKIFLAGGGTGIAPLLFLAEFLIEKRDITFFYGARSVDCIAFDILPYGVNYIFSTDDGSYGYKGLVSEALKDHIKKENIPDVIYAGGPYEMLKAIGKISQEYKIPAFMSMENRMVCGTGLCYGCVTKIKNEEGWEYKRVCKDGPVFSSEEVLWE